MEECGPWWWLEKRRLHERQSRYLDREELAGMRTQLLHQESPLGSGWWGSGYQDEGCQAQPLYFTQAAIQQPAHFLDGNLFIVERGQKIQENVRLRQRGRAFEQGQHLVAGEGSPDVSMLQGGGWIGDAAANEPDQVVGWEAIAAVQNGQRAAHGQFRHDLRDRLKRSAGSTEDGERMGLRQGQNIHAPSLDLYGRTNNPPEVD